MPFSVNFKETGAKLRRPGVGLLCFQSKPAQKPPFVVKKKIPIFVTEKSQRCVLLRQAPVETRDLAGSSRLRSRLFQQDKNSIGLGQSRPERKMQTLKWLYRGQGQSGQLRVFSLKDTWRHFFPTKAANVVVDVLIASNIIRHFRFMPHWSHPS